MTLLRKRLQKEFYWKNEEKNLSKFKNNFSEYEGVFNGNFLNLVLIIRKQSSSKIWKNFGKKFCKFQKFSKKFWDSHENVFRKIFDKFRENFEAVFRQNFQHFLKLFFQMVNKFRKNFLNLWERILCFGNILLKFKRVWGKTF